MADYYSADLHKLIYNYQMKTGSGTVSKLNFNFAPRDMFSEQNVSSQSSKNAQSKSHARIFSSKRESQIYSSVKSQLGEEKIEKMANIRIKNQSSDSLMVDSS